MYVPAHFRADEEAVHELLGRPGAVDLVTASARGLAATTLPMFYDRERAELTGHLARNNDQWREAHTGSAMVIKRGPDAYISPSWYPSKVEHGRVVPTWNYLTVHVHGVLTVHEDASWLEDQVRRLTAQYEDGRARPWSVDDAPAGFLSGQLRAIVGVSMSITAVEAKFKMSQNRSAADIDGVVHGLEQEGEFETAAAVLANRGDR